MTYLFINVERQGFKEMLSCHGKTFVFEPHEIGCVDPSVVTPMVIFTIPHVLWNFHHVLVPRSHLPKLV